MCALFGFLDYGHSVSARVLQKLVQLLANASEVRGTHACGIAYNQGKQLTVYKRPKPAHKLHLRIPNGTRVVMGHTRFTTQGSQKMNYNNHPFRGTLDVPFALAHNGVLYNDGQLRIQKGGELQTLLEDSQHIYSDEDKRAELTEITQNASFASTALITTKVAENGISLHDDSLAVIVAETFDPIVLQQVIGRARVKRKKPREIVVLIPDYTASHLGSIMNKVYSARIEFDRASESPDFTMQYTPQPNPYIYYDAIAQKPTLNELGRKELQRQLDFLQQMRDEESNQPHAFVRYVLNLYGKDTTQIESLSIHYSKLSECHTRICTAWEAFKESNMGADALADLKAALKAACNETGAYPKELKSNIQVDTVNDILRFAGICEKVLPESKVYKITAITD